MFLLPIRGKVFAEYDESTRKMVLAEDVTHEMLDKNLVYEIDFRDLDGETLCPTCQRPFSHGK